MDENMELNKGCDKMSSTTKFNNEIDDNSLSEFAKISNKIGHFGHAIDFEKRMLEREVNRNDAMTYLTIHMSDTNAWAPLLHILYFLSTPFDQKRLPQSQEDIKDYFEATSQLNIHSIYRDFLDSVRSITEKVGQRHALQYEEHQEEISSALPDALGNNYSAQHKNQEKMIYQVHSEGHLVVISQYSNKRKDVVKYRASTELLSDIICKKKQPVIIDIDRLSNLQLAGIRKALIAIKPQITVKQVNKKGKNVWIIKHKR